MRVHAPIAVGLCLLAISGMPSSVQAEKPTEGPGARILPDARARARLQAAGDLMRNQDWGRAVAVLQDFLDEHEDRFVDMDRVGQDGKARHVERTTARREAERLLSSLPKAGLDAYQLHAGVRAKELLTEAKKEGDPAVYAEIVRRYRYTTAGEEALLLLGSHHLGRGRPGMALVCFESLLARPTYKPTAALLVKAALAHQRLGDRAATARQLERLAQLNPAGARLGNETVAIRDLRDRLERLAAFDNIPLDHPLFQGTAARTSRTPGDKPFLDETTKKWVMPMIHQQQTNAWIEQAVKLQREQTREPVLPQFFPIATQGLVVFRSYYGIQAVKLQTGTLAWDSDFDGSIDSLIGPHHDPNQAALMRQWVPMYQGSRDLRILYEHSSLGTLSTNNHLVFGVDDLAVPPHPNLGVPTRQRCGALADQVFANRLMAIGLKSGKRVWQAGGRGAAAGPLADSFFFGAPLPLGDELFSMVETEAELRLVCLNADYGSLKWKQPLLRVNTPATRDVGRRLQAVNLAYDDGVLICPTNAGHVFGIDPLLRTVLWTHSYEERTFGVHPLIPTFKCSAPSIQDGRVVVAPSDADCIRCLDLRTGRLLWEARRDDDLYLAGVHRGRVVLVGKSSCRALNLSDGKPAWNVGTGAPAGHGVASGKIYYLPLAGAGAEQGPEVCAIDVEAGEIVAHVKSRKQELPGNLIFHDGRVISQTVREVTAYPQLKVKLAEMNALIAKNPKDPEGLLERADLRRSDGDFRGAVDDLRIVLAGDLESDMRSKSRRFLFESLTELLLRDFSPKTVNEYQELCQVPVPEGATVAVRSHLTLEEQQRRAMFHRVVARGQEQQGDVLEALRHYEALARLSKAAGLLSGIEDPRLRSGAETWARSRILAMVMRADGDKRKKLLEAIQERYQEARRSKDINDLRLFVTLFEPVLAEVKRKP